MATLIAARPRSRVPRSRNEVLLHDMAMAWARIKHRINELSLGLKVLDRRLRRLLRRNRLTSIWAGKDLIQLIIERQKRPGKRDLVGFFGEARAEEFWSGLRDHIYEYLTFARPGRSDRAGQRR